jgi:3-oxoacyl-[acyl-carrier protein] reductase
VRLENRVAIITGASRGIGAATAEAFAREGAAVAVNSLPDEEMESLAAEVVSRIESAGGTAIVVPADVSDPGQVEAMVDATRGAFGDPDIVVANAAYSERRPWHEMDVELWDRTLAVNVRGTFLCARAAYPGMRRLGRGSIITVTSVMFELGMAGSLAYVASKGAVIGLTRALAREVGGEGIRVNAVMPGAIRTEHEVERGGDESESARRAAERQSLPRRGYAEDLTGTFVFLASDESAFVTGQVINVDGGWVMY